MVVGCREGGHSCGGSDRPWEPSRHLRESPQVKFHVQPSIVPLWFLVLSDNKSQWLDQASILWEQSTALLFVCVGRSIQPTPQGTYIYWVTLLVQLCRWLLEVVLSIQKLLECSKPSVHYCDNYWLTINNAGGRGEAIFDQDLLRPQAGPSI